MADPFLSCIFNFIKSRQKKLQAIVMIRLPEASFIIT